MVGFIASVMYLVQARRLRSKVMPGQGMKLLSLERLEDMHRHAILAAFPLLTAGVVVGMALLARAAAGVRSWTDPRVLTAGVLWALFAVLLYLRYSLHVRGRRVFLPHHRRLCPAPSSLSPCRTPWAGEARREARGRRLFLPRHTPVDMRERLAFDTDKLGRAARRVAGTL